MNASTSYETAGTLARKLGLPESWLRREAEASRIPSIKIGKFRRFCQADVERALRRRAFAGIKEATTKQQQEPASGSRVVKT